MRTMIQSDTAADRQRLAQGFNEGRYIVIIANSVGGEGANLQTRTCAVALVPSTAAPRRALSGPLALALVTGA